MQVFMNGFSCPYASEMLLVLSNKKPNVRLKSPQIHCVNINTLEDNIYFKFFVYETLNFVLFPMKCQPLLATKVFA